MGVAHPKTMGNQPAAETRTIAAPAPAETNRDEMQQAMDADVTRVGGAYDPDVDFKKNLRLRNPMLDYTKMELLGQGAFGAVYKIQDKKTKVLYAMKEINVQRTDPAILQREMAVALGVNHEYLLPMEACYQHKNILSAILPIMRRPANSPNDEPDMMSYLLNKGAGCSELEGAKVTHHVASAMKYLHEELNTYHRDLKPDNVLVGPAGLDGLKVTDYGLARFVDPNSAAGLTLGKGTNGYMAREMMEGIGDRHYDGKVDVFSLGVVLYSAMVLTQPFGQTQTLIGRAEPADFTAPEWRQISRSCKDLCQKMLEHDPAKRLNINEVLDHPWLKQNGF